MAAGRYIKLIVELIAAHRLAVQQTPCVQQSEDQFWRILVEPNSKHEIRHKNGGDDRNRTGDSGFAEREWLSDASF